MNATRRKRLVAFVLDVLCRMCEDDSEAYLPEELHCSAEEMQSGNATYNVDNDRRELEVEGEWMLDPNGNELDAIAKPGKKGNRRTIQMFRFGCVLLRDSLERYCEEYFYAGEVERFNDTHVTVNDVSFLRPTEEELTELYDDAAKIAENLPPIPSPAIGWDVWRVNDDGVCSKIDTVFYDATCDRKYVYDSLVNHDGYDSDIRLRC